MNAAGCDTFFSDLVSAFVFGILQIRSGCIQIFSGCNAPTCTPLATGLPAVYKAEMGTEMLGT